MASVGGVSGSNTTSSLYNSANVISGLASGLDTESMIEGLVQSYQTKIQTLTNQATKLEWKQEAYRSIISKMYAFSSKYASYTSSTNLLSPSFFNNAIKVATMGKYADKVTASGRTESDVKLKSVTQMATSARYNTKSKMNGVSDDFSITASDSVKFDDTFTTGSLSGSLALQYGNQTVSIVFDQYSDIIPETKMVNGQEVALTDSEKAEELYKMINDKLSNEQITLSSGETKSAADLIDVKFSGGKITFSDKSNGGNNVYIASASGSVESVLGLDLEDADEKKPATIDTSKILTYHNKTTVGSQISGKTMNISLDGKTKSITMPTIKKGSYDGASTNDYFVDADGNAIKDADGNVMEVNGKNYVTLLQQSIDKEFGQGKITVSNEAADDDSLQLKIKSQANSDLIINTDAGKALGIGNASTNYLNTSKTLGELLPEGTFAKNADGTDVKQDFIINGVKIGSYNSSTKLSEILNDINNNTEAGVKVTFSQTTRQFSFVSKDTGVENEINISGGLAEAMFGSTEVSGEAPKFGDAYGAPWLGNSDIVVTTANGEVTVSGGGTIEDVAERLNKHLSNFGQTASYNKYTGQLEITDKSGAKVDFSMSVDDEDFGLVNLEFNEKYAPDISYTPGQDAKFVVEVNGQTMEMTRPSNSVNIDGLTMNFKNTFQAEPGDEVTFQRSTDSDKIVDAVKSMVADFNEMLSEIRGQYATLPYRTSSGAFKTYEPLSDDDKATLSENAIQNYEAKAKQGLLFNDSNLSGLYTKLLGIFTDGTTNQQQLSNIGISISYSSVDGSAQLMLDENKLRDALNNDPDAVTDVFTRAAATSDGQPMGIMQQMKTQLDRYGALTGSTKGILVEQAGTPLSSLSLMNNAWQTQIDNLSTQIEKWQDKLSAQVDKYTSMFSKLEVLINQMNSQSSTLAGLMGGGY